jgi:hypothetical protein
MNTVIANGSPITEKKQKALNHPLITGGYLDRRELQRSKKRSGWPQYLVEPQHIEGCFEGGTV